MGALPEIDGLHTPRKQLALLMVWLFSLVVVETSLALETAQDRNSAILVLVFVLALKHWSQLFFSRTINNRNLLAMYAKRNSEL